MGGSACIDDARIAPYDESMSTGTRSRQTTRTKFRVSPPTRRRTGLSYVFRVQVERDGQKWHSTCPVLERHGAATWGRTREEALRHIQEVVAFVVESMRERGERIPRDVATSSLPLVTVST